MSESDQVTNQVFSSRKLLFETIAVLALAILLIHLTSFLQLAHPFFTDIYGSLTAVILIYLPFFIASYKRQNIDYWKWDKENVMKSLKYFAVASLVIFPLSFLVNHYYQKLFFGLDFVNHPAPHWITYALTQVLLVGFPEEFFFRGYMQENLSQVYPPQQRVFGAPFGKAQIYTCLIFAFSHSLITIQWWHMFIFFPALVFAWLKEKTGTIWAPTLFHAASNLFSYWVFLHYR